MWCCRRLEKISWTDRVRNEEVLHRVKGERHILHTVKRRKANWIVTSSVRSALLHVIEGTLEGRTEITGTRGRRCKQLLENLKAKRGYCKLEEEAQDHSL
jgi:hypothetical protein